MIRKLRTKLVAAAMLSLLAVLTVILGVILLTNYRGIVSDADRILSASRSRMRSASETIPR